MTTMKRKAARRKQLFYGGGTVGGLFALLFIWVFLVTGHQPDAGQEIVLVEKPIIFGHGGVVPEPVKTGRQYTWWTTSGVVVEMRPQQFPSILTTSCRLTGFRWTLTPSFVCR